MCFPSLGHLPIAEVERHLRSFAFDKNDERYIPNTIEAWLSLVARIAEHARRQGLYDGPEINKFVSGLNAQNRDRETHGPEAIREFARQVEMPFNIWYLMGALNGFRPRERCVFQWGHFTEDPPTMAIRLNLVDGKIKQVSDRRIDDRPISRSIAALLSAWRKVTPFGGDDDYIFASSTGKLPVATSRIYREHLDPAADALSVRRVSLYRLHHIAIRLTGKHGLTREQQTIVLKLHSRRAPPIPIYGTPADVEQTRLALDRMDEEIFGATMDGEIFGPRLSSRRAPWVQTPTKATPPANIERPADTGASWESQRHDDATADHKRRSEVVDGFSVDLFRRARVAAGQNQQEAGEELGLTRTQVSKIEREIVQSPHLGTRKAIRDYIAKYLRE